MKQASRRLLGSKTTSGPIAEMAIRCPQYEVRASAPVAATGETARGNRSAAIRHSLSTTRTTPMLATSSTADDECGSLVSRARRRVCERSIVRMAIALVPSPATAAIPPHTISRRGVSGSRRSIRPTASPTRRYAIQIPAG